MIHIPVLKKETIKFLAPQKNQNFIDATLGFAGHSLEILNLTSPSGKLLGIDQDLEAIKASKKNLDQFKNRVTFSHANFSELEGIVEEWKVSRIDGILLDLGVSTYQLLSQDRGFSFNISAPLDMRMNPDEQSLTAKEIVNRYSEKELSRILFELGEERFARRIARNIVEKRRMKPIEASDELVQIIKVSIPPQKRFQRHHHFATSTFRALRMEVNSELINLEKALPQAVNLLSPGGRIVIISFHSLEDRIVKNFFRENENLEILTKKPIIASEQEIQENPKSRSAKLRAAVKR